VRDDVPVGADGCEDHVHAVDSVRCCRHHTGDTFGAF
jgi:hypothetical protein